jgi:hypothetical protein
MRYIWQWTLFSLLVPSITCCLVVKNRDESYGNV